jgi:uroporphyrin-III C-methyltransferase / precorrin-2 dehydrogenase / sirohydrochlorin ferrochelatase
MSGRVALVGAGPGDPALLTRKAVARLRSADLVLYDALVPPAMLKIARRARRFYVGKRAGRHSMTQDAINRLMIRAARKGDRVVRLKCGDPFVFGRGGEEAIALRAANVPVEIVPGVTSAFAAPALAGIPVTHRGAATAVAVVSGHAPEAYEPLLNGLAPSSATVIVLMGIGTRAAIAACLLQHAWPADTPAAIVFGAAQPGAHTWTGRLADLGQAPIADPSAPGTIVIGTVVALAPVIAGAEAAAPHFSEAPAPLGAGVALQGRRRIAHSARG